MATCAAQRLVVLLSVLCIMLLSAMGYAGTVPAGQTPQAEIPAELKPWVPWVLHDREEQTCTLRSNTTTQRYCTWPSRLELDVTETGASFSQQWVVETRGLVALPGSSPFWPDAVMDNGEQVVVTAENGRPMVWLEPGNHQLTGEFNWPQLPEYLPVPPATGMVALRLHGTEVSPLQLDEQGHLWFKKQKKTVQKLEQSLTVQVFRNIDDSVPLIQHLRILLVVSGSPREVTLGLETGREFVPLSLQSPLPVRLDSAGRIQLQVRPGQWQIQLSMRNTLPRSPATLGQGTINGTWPEKEIWVFKSNPKLRQVEIEGLPSVDPSRTSLPEDWKNLPAYLIQRGEHMRILEKHRGNPNPVPNRLQLARRIWLDEQGSGMTVQDTITGTMSRGWRLNVDPSQELGRVEAEGTNRLITRLPGSDKVGIEVRKGRVSLQAESRIKVPVQGGRLVLPALGWDHMVEQVSAELQLPPGWKLFTASGIDKVSTWLNNWTLLDIFLVLIISLSTARILGWGWGLVALCALVLIYHQPASPRFLWLPLLGLLALQKIIPAKSGERLLRISGLFLLVILIISAVPFMVREVRVGLFPQLEYGRFYPIVRGGDQEQRQKQDMIQADVAMESMSVPMQAKSKAGLGRYNLQSAPVTPKRIQVDPRDMIQTGPGLPDWSWKKIPLRWNGPVRLEQKMSFVLLSPLVNTVLAFVRVLLLAALLVGFLRQCLGLGKRRAQMAKGTALAVFFTLLLSGGQSFAPGNAAAVVPPPEVLQQLQDRLLAPPECGSRCASINSCLITTADDVLKVTLGVESLVRGALPLPGKNRFFDQVALDGKPAEIVRLDKEGIPLIRLESGTHTVILTKKLQGRNTLSFSFPLLPQRGEALTRNWSISGLRENGKLDHQITLNRITPKAAQPPLEDPAGVHLPAFVQVNRTLHMGLKWSVETRVIRRTANTAVALDIPLLPGERVTTDKLHIKENTVRVNMEPEQPFFSWHSAMNPVDLLTFAAPETSSWTERWFLDVSPIWHVNATGIPAVNQTSPGGKRFPEYQPFPGESLQLAVSRPEGVPGPTMTITRSTMEIKPGRRATEVSLAFTLIASRGMQHTITLPAGIDLQKSLIDNTKYPLQLEGTTLVIPVKPGRQEVELGWRSDRRVGLKMVSQQVDLGVPSVNASIKMQVPVSRWILLAGGPRIGPAVLFWGELLVIILIAVGLGRITFTPLSALHWLLLGLGLSQIPASFSAVVVVWLLLLGLRKTKGEELAGKAGFNLVQVILVVLTLLSLAALFTAIQQGLLGSPDMQIGGNGSSGHLLRWYQDRNDAVLPQVWVVTVPLLVYRISMLLWALWLAVSLLKWLRWGWECFSDTILWKQAAPVKKEGDVKKKRFFGGAAQQAPELNENKSKDA